MMEPRNDPKGPTILLFGPQVTSINRQSLDQLRRTLSETDGSTRHWILNTVAELPSLWGALIKKIPQIAGTIPGEILLANLDSWLRRGLDDGTENINLSNTLLTPLVVIIQLTQYWRYLELNQNRNGNGNNNSEPKGGKRDLQADFLTGHNLHGGNNVETLGFCTGLLSAFAIASSRTQEEFEKYGAVSIRLALLVGALVDAEEAWKKVLGHGRSKSYATAWSNAKEREDVKRIVDNLFPKAYISVLYDEARATITTSEHTAPQLLQQLLASSVSTTEVGIQGSFHSPDTITKENTDALIELCSSVAGLQFADANADADADIARLALSSLQYTKGADGSMHEVALRAILVQQCNWYETFATVAEDSVVALFGPDRSGSGCVPPTLMRRLRFKPAHCTAADVDEAIPESHSHSKTPDFHPSPSNTPVLNTPPSRALPSNTQQPFDTTNHDATNHDAIAVVGMSIRVAGADDLDEFSQMLQTGESQHEQIGPDRLMFDTIFREGVKDPSRKWYGNFIRDVDAFDHKFFKRSPRESSTMDPQQRLFLQAAYQAVQQSGYFTETTTSTPTRDKHHVGVYLGACAGDYEHHVASHAPNAFTATGNLKSFIPGKVSHYFGWTGPAMTFDTACSASAVAIHTACRNLLSGECTAALAGGVATMSNFLWFQNLAGAGFLSPTGQCKPFDERADGYCRSEGIACVFLKKMSDAIADGNSILGCIASTAVYQNRNCTPLFVPNSPSLSQLFTDAIYKAKLTPRDVSLVEAHGTGTPVGDPAEYESIRMVLGGPIRSSPLPIGSVKGHIGHTEGASGVISLIKIIMMMQESYIPPQASFSKMSHHINVTPLDMMEVVTSLRPWSEEYKVALINNYGASGSNASIIVSQSPYSNKDLISVPIRRDANLKRLPFWITGLDSRSISAYSRKLVPYLRSRPNVTLADVSFNINRQSNPSLPQGLVFSCSSVAELDDKLSQLASAPNPIELGILTMKPERPVILCFGGQVSTFVGLDRKLYESISVLRSYLDQCDAMIQSLGLESIFPEIFSRMPVQDTVKLQTMLFSMQYACARSWIACGLSGKIFAVVGHSFGEITALCISGVLDLRDTIKLVAGRAKLVRDEWDSDCGAMMAIEAEEALVHDLLLEANTICGSDRPASIACYNGPRSFTLAGPTKAIDIIAEIALRDQRFSSIRSKRLNVTNAFHSSLVEPLESSLEKIGSNLAFNHGVIPSHEEACLLQPCNSTPGKGISIGHISGGWLLFDNYHHGEQSSC
ncbi:hypothetical protein B0O99DRAFT_666107 [Bisporella sp. PMI_857]|nr:hypothetical protein B0O99DRAFT_666107 [Bisporella sp. PMI_857]